MSDSFAMAEALWRLGWLTAAGARDAVLDAIAAGHDAPALYDFLAGGYGTAADIHDAFARVLAELDRAPLDSGVAAIRFARAHAREIASGDLAALTMLRANWRELRDREDLPDVARPFVTLATRHMFYSAEPELLPDYLAELTDTARLFLATTDQNCRR